MDRRFPSELMGAIAALSEGRSRQELAGRAAALSEGYRRDRGSKGTVSAEEDALVYALARMPATYASTLFVLEELAARAPAFAPKTLLDAGAGPGTASWAAARALHSLGSVVMLDNNSRFRTLAEALKTAAPSGALRRARVEAGEIGRTAAGERFDLVIAAYALTEMEEAAAIAAAQALLGQCAGVLALVEPGRPRDYSRLMAVRSALIAAGAEIIAPCPHSGTCPLPAGDWCHFSARLARSRDHRQLKGGAAPFEDEKFSYLVVGRSGLGIAPADERVVRPPRASKAGVELMLCTQGGLAKADVRRADGAAYRAARKLGWGDAVWRERA